MARQRVRDEEAIRAAAEIAQEVHASPDAAQTGIIIGARAYRQGERKADNMVKSLQAEVEQLRADAVPVEVPPEMNARAVAKAMGIQPWEARRFLRRAKVRIVKRT